MSGATAGGTGSATTRPSAEMLMRSPVRHAPLGHAPEQRGALAARLGGEDHAMASSSLPIGPSEALPPSKRDAPARRCGRARAGPAGSAAAAG